MRTIGRRLTEGHGPDRVALCSYCGVAWLRSELTRDPSGNLACPDDAPGLDILSLTEGNARLMRSRQPKTVGPSDGNADQFTSPPSPGFIDPNGPPPRPVNTGPTGPLSVVVNMWLRSDTVEQTTVVGRVSRWTDKSTRGNSVPALSSAGEPVLVPSDATLGGLPTVTSDGANHFLQLASFKGGAPLWGWVIYRPDVAATRTLMGAGVNFQQGTTAGTMRMLTNAGLGTEVPSPTGQWERALLNFNVSGLDSLQIGAGGFWSAASAGQRFTSAFSLFSGFGGSAKIAAAVAEVLLTNGPPTVAEIAAIEAYGVARYGGGLFA